MKLITHRFDCGVVSASFPCRSRNETKACSMHVHVGTYNQDQKDQNQKMNKLIIHDYFLFFAQRPILSINIFSGTMNIDHREARQ